MISDREWDEMRNANQLRLRLLRDEIRETRRGNRDEAIDAIEGVADATNERPDTEGATAQETANRDAAIQAVLDRTPTSNAG